MNWNAPIKGFIAYLKLERSLSEHSVEAYSRDILKLSQYLDLCNLEINPGQVELSHLEGFLKWIHDVGLGERSQSRIISGIRSFYKYLLLEDMVETDPTELLESPKLAQTIPEVLSYDEIMQMMEMIDHSTPHGVRNRAMIETMYACGLRVSELVNLLISNLYFDVGVIKVIGKNNKERIVPIGSDAIKHIRIYTDEIRNKMKLIHQGHEDFLFLNRRGKKLTRVAVFQLVKDLSAKAQINKKVSPHTFRHSFATHLVEGGANLKAVQDMLGHESITTTEIYTHLDTEFLRETLLMFHPMSKKNKQGE
jgi:integrase/recombinase XerD